MNIRILSITLLFGFGVQTGLGFDQATLDFVKKNKRLPKMSEIGKEGDALSTDLSNADLSDASMEKANLIGANLKGAKLGKRFKNNTPSFWINADFTGADLTNAILSGGQFNGANFTNAKLTGANISNLGNFITNFDNAIFTGADRHLFTNRNTDNRPISDRRRKQ